jgi:carbamoyl-phosphate synthase small subunit
MESDRVHLGAVIVRDLSPLVSNYRSAQTLDAFCKAQGVPGLAGVDTRALTLRLREAGCLNAVICHDPAVPVADLVAKAKGWSIVGQDLVAQVTCSAPYEWVDPTGAEWEFNPKATASRPYHVVAYDFGVKTNILRRLASLGCRLTVVPASTPAADVLALNPDGIFLSNGPGDPSALPYAVEAVRSLLGQKPMFGICMGHQVLGQALGGSTFKLKFGHHGGNHPIRAPGGRIEISAQNHNFAVDPASLPADAQVTHINLNDGTCAGLAVPSRSALSIQYHPEASPGPHDADVCFEAFIDLMAAEKKGKGAAGAPAAAGVAA